MTQFHSFDPVVTPPIVMPPRNACDCHFHIMGDPVRFPPLPRVRQYMAEASLEALLKLHAALGIDRGIIVGTTSHGSDYSMLLDTLARIGPNYRASVHHTVLDEQPDAYIQTLHDAGVRGVRFNFLKMLGYPPTAEQISRSVARVRELGWYCKIQPDYYEPLESFEPFDNVDCPVVIDHLGRAPANQGPDGSIATKILELLKRGNFWLLLSNAYKCTTSPYPWDDMLPVVRRFIDAAPDRLLWASDWPHTFHDTPPPNDGDLYNFFHRATSAAERQRILVDNPAVMFGFPTT